MQTLQCIRRTVAGSAGPSRIGIISRSITGATPPSTPWFIDTEGPVQSITRHTPPHLAPKTHELPENLSVGIRQLFLHLSKSPLLEPSTLSVERPVAALPGPPLPRTLPKGRRKRGRTYSGEGLVEEPGSIWEWVVTAQVCTLLASSLSFLLTAVSQGERRHRKPGVDRSCRTSSAKDCVSAQPF
jgi:hypothetical protein